MKPGDFVRHINDHSIKGRVVERPSRNSQWERERIGEDQSTYMTAVTILTVDLLELRTFDRDVIEPVPAA